VCLCVWRCVGVGVCVCTHMYIYAAILNRKWKARRFSLIYLPFAHCANRSLSLISLLTKKQTEVILLQTN
jgi:hypothetical protein